MMQRSVWMMHFKLITAMSAVVQFTQSPKFLSLQVRDAAIFNCQLLGCAAKHYIWDRIPEFENGSQGFNEDLLNGSRISVSLSGTLRIENLTVFDNGLYYCRPIHLCVKNTPGATRSNGTRLTVTVPSLHLQSNLSSNNPELLILICSAVGFYPSYIVLSWHHSLLGVPHTTSQEVPEPLLDGTYSSRSTLQVNSTLWVPGTEIGCEANHTSTIRPLKKYIRNVPEKINTRETYWYSFAFLALPLILGCIYLLINFFRSTAATETSKPTDEDGNEMEIELQYSTLFQKNLKKYTSSQNENDFRCIYSEVKMKEGSLTECENSMDCTVPDIHETPNVTILKSPRLTTYSPLTCSSGMNSSC
ncbi:uncharacterized protein LOC127529786 isoform X2 [Erpetoichthys calabaricus]|uniref:uncharacterized protein LOC127529786 isoform X2 n=1 Tax=Erpetoichthys calabaricus TaxID=27687 RepID=UPI0022345DAA|nr:uncharacterized protein LOC127529786 isoform X2 [Erpetoichthys calabaricus]